MDAVRQAIVAALGEVPGIGTVHAYERYAADMAALARLYTRNGLLLGWFVSRGAVRESAPSRGRRVESATWHITGYRGFVDADASELLFAELVDAIRARFRTSDALGGAWPWDGDGGQAGIQVEDAGTALFAGVLAHYAKLSLPTTRYLDGD